MSQINLQHGSMMEQQLTGENRKTKEWKRTCSEVSKNRGIRGVSPEKEKVGYCGKDLQKRKVLSLEWKSEGVMDDESGELMELMEEMALKELGLWGRIGGISA